MNIVKILLIQEKLSHYNLPLFDLISKESSYSLTVLHTEKINRTFAFEQLSVQYFTIGGLYFFKENISMIAERFDIVVCMHNLRWPQLFILSVQKKHKFKLVYWGIGLSASYKKKIEAFSIFNYLRLFLSLKADALILYSYYAANFYIKYGYSRKKIFVANNTIQVKVSENNLARKDSILFIGTLYAEKGTDFLLTAYKKALKINQHIPKLIIVGDGPEFENITKFIKANQLETMISLKGRIENHSEISELYQRAIICVSPFQAGLSVLQSMGYGVPFVTSRAAITGGEKFNIRNGLNGIFFDNIDQLVDIIIATEKHKDLFNTLGKIAKLDYYHSCSIENMVDSFIKCFTSILEKKYED